MRKIDGIKEIEKLRLPTEKFEFVEHERQLKFVNERDEKIGWGIRCYLKNEGEIEYHLPTAHYLKKEEVPKKIKEFREKLGEGAIFSIHVSLTADKSGAILIENDKIVIEAANGWKAPMESKREVTYILPRKKNAGVVSTIGKKDFLTSDEIKKLKDYASRVLQSNVLLEWAIVGGNQFIFYDYRKIK